MKKRKELDALVGAKSVAAGLAGKGGKGRRLQQPSSGTKTGAAAAAAAAESQKAARAHQLLGNDSDSSELLDDYTILHPHQRTKKGGSMMRGMCCAASCLPLCLVVLVSTCMVALGTLLWLHLGLREDLDLMRTHLQKVETQNKETPETLHDYHIQLKGLESNVTAFEQSLKKINTEIAALNDAVKKLKDVSTDLRESIAAAPEIKTLPRDVVSITESVAALGSKISMLESNVEDLKKGQRQLTDSERELKTEHQQIKGSLAGLSVQRDTTPREDAQAVQNRLTDYLHQELVHMTASIEELNMTTATHLKEIDQHLTETNDSLSWVSNDLAQLHVFVYQNLSSVGSYSGGKGIDPSALGPALKLEAQNMLHEVLVNGSQVQSSEQHVAAGSGWKEVIAHARQVSLAYWALLKDLSLTPSDVQEPSVLLETVFHKALTQLTANTTTALQALNNSMEILLMRMERLESWRQGSQPSPGTTPTATTTTTPAPTPIALDPAPSGKLLEVQSGVAPNLEPPGAPPDVSSTSSSASANQGGLVAAALTATPTPAPAVLNVLNSLRSKTATSFPDKKAPEREYQET